MVRKILLASILAIFGLSSLIGCIPPAGQSAPANTTGSPPPDTTAAQ